MERTLALGPLTSVLVVLALVSGDGDKGRRLLEKAEKTCLRTNSLNVEVTLDSEVNAE